VTHDMGPEWPGAFGPSFSGTEIDCCSGEWCTSGQRRIFRCPGRHPRVADDGRRRISGYQRSDQ
jgi:hypothetical protein